MSLQQKDSETIVSEITSILERGRAIQYWSRNEVVRENLSIIEKYQIEAVFTATEDFIEAIEMYLERLERKTVRAEKILVGPGQLKLQLS